jgi:hypothetical protein
MSAVNGMSLERFAEIVAAYGAEPRAWPEGERDAALALCAQNPYARELRDEAGALDALLAESETPKAEVALENRIMADFRKGRSSQISFANRAFGAGAIAASLVLGVTAAWIVLQPKGGVDLSDPAVWEVLGDDLEFGAKDLN